MCNDFSGTPAVSQAVCLNEETRKPGENPVDGFMGSLSIRWRLPPESWRSFRKFGVFRGESGSTSRANGTPKFPKLVSKKLIC
jgi:hypothetical protein